MNYQFKSSQSIIAKVFRDLGVQDSSWIDDAIEWIGEALEHIGTYSQTIPKVSVVEVTDFKTTVPTDMYILDEIKYSNSESVTAPDAEEFNYTLVKADAGLHPSLFSKENPNLNTNSQRHNFILKENYIQTSFENKWIAIIYRAFYLDESGYPMVPDLASFSEAFMWYITMKLILRGLKHPVVNYEFARAEWLRYCTQARNEYNMPDKTDYEAFRQKWVQMIPRYDRDIVDLYDNVKQPSDFTTNYQENSG